MEEEVLFVFYDGDKRIRKDLMYCSSVFTRDFSKHERIGMERRFESEYIDFFHFLQRGEVPFDPKRQKNVYNLLVEWKFQFPFLESFLFRISGLIIPIKFNNKVFNVNFSRFFIISSLFRDLYSINPSCDLEFEFLIDDNSFFEFLDVVHGVKSLHEIQNYVEVFKICEFFGCSSLSNLFDIKEIILKDIIYGINHPDFERYVRENLRDFLIKPEFASVPLPILIRLFQKYNWSFSLRELRVFLNNYYINQPMSFFILFNCINLKLHSIDEFYEIGVFFKHYFPGIEEELNMKMRKEIEDQKKLEELTKRIIELERREEEAEGIRSGKWRSTKPPDFEGNIFEAAAKGKLTSIIYLVANGTNVNKKYPNEKYDDNYMKNSTPIHFSSSYGHLRVVEFLINHKASLNAKDDSVAFYYLI